MEEITSFNQPHTELDPPASEWWIGAIPPNLDRPTTWHYVPVLFRNPAHNQAGQPEHKWKALVPDWYEHFPESPGLFDRYVWYFDVKHVQQWRAYWSGPGSAVNYSIFLQIDDNDKPFGRAIHFGPTPSQVNKITLGAVWDQQTGEAVGGVQVNGSGQVNIANFAILADGTFYIEPGQIVEENGKKYWKIIVGSTNYGIELTPLS